MYFEQSRNSEGSGGVGAGPWAGQFNFQTDTANPGDTNYAYANALLGTFRDYTEIDAFSEVIGKRYIGEAYLQDTWKASRRLTFDYGVRFLWYTPWYSTQPAAVFVPERYDPAKAPRLYQPAVVNGANVALDPVTGETKANVFVGSFVPGTGDRYNGMVTSADPNYPKGFRDSQGIEPEPRVGLAWDLTGDGKTALHASAGLYHNPHVNANGLDAMARNPPAQNTPSINYGTMDTLLAAGAAGAFSNRPSAVFGIERDAQTPRSYNYSVGVQRELGWGTVVDVTYAGFQMRNAEMNVSINSVPDGARFVDVNPQNRNPQNNAAKPDEFLRPYLGYQDITIRSHFGTGSYNSMQVQLNRRYIRGLQLGVAYTLAKTVSDGTNYNTVRPGEAWNEGPTGSTQWHNLVVNYTWDVPRREPSLEQPVDARAPRRLAGVGRHGDRQRRLVRRRQPHHDRQLRLRRRRRRHAGEARRGPGLQEQLRSHAGEPRQLPGRLGVRPSHRPRRHRQRAGRLLPAAADREHEPVGLQELPDRRRAPDPVPLGDVQRLQPGQLVGHQHTSQFNPAGEQVNLNFGKATAARDPRIMQGAIRFSF